MNIWYGTGISLSAGLVGACGLGSVVIAQPQFQGSSKVFGPPEEGGGGGKKRKTQCCFQGL